jgi:signal transduction histidine kinase
VTDGVVVPVFRLGGMAARTEERIGRMLVIVRVTTCLFAYIPLFTWRSLAHPWLWAVVAVAASGEAVWFAVRLRRSGTLRDRTLVTVDVLFCLALMLIGTRAAVPELRTAAATELIPTVLAGAAIVGFGFEFGRVQIAAITLLGTGWVFAVLPDVRLKLFSDLLGLAVWYVVASRSMREFRALSRMTDQAQAAAQASAVEAEAARQRERLHLEIHDNMLPILDRLLAGEPVGDRLLRDARLVAGRARRLTADPRSTTLDAADQPDFTTLINHACDTCAAGLVLEPVLVITVEPAPELAEALSAATGEALRNAVRHAGARCRVNLYVESSASRGEIIVRDHGPGFDTAAVVRGGGFTGTFAALHRHGAEWTVDSAPGRGTTVTVTWPSRSGNGSAAPRPVENDHDQ